MSSQVDEILFAPVFSGLPWREQCRQIAEYITKHSDTLRPMRKHLDLNRPRPAGSLLLEELMELYHIHNQRFFYYVIVGTSQRNVFELTFDGSLIFGRYEDGKVPMLGNFDGRRSIRDLNLVANSYTRHYVFGCEAEAREYLKSLS